MGPKSLGRKMHPRTIFAGLALRGRPGCQGNSEDRTTGGFQPGPTPGDAWDGGSTSENRAWGHLYAALVSLHHLAHPDLVAWPKGGGTHPSPTGLGDPSDWALTEKVVLVTSVLL